jgi:predicted CopG family antitoxin
MQNTTIAINPTVKSEIEQFGTKGESYSEIILRLLKSAKQRQINDLLMDEKDTISIEDALANAKKRWQE